MLYIVTPLTYWLLTILWLAIFLFCLTRLKSKRISSPFFFTVLIILTIDAGRTLVESVYFGVMRSTSIGLGSASLSEMLSRPEWLIIPKFFNLLSALCIAYILWRRWLPQQEAEYIRKEEHLKELEAMTDAQQATEASLRETEERFRKIVEASPMGMHLYELQMDGRLTLEDANPAADTILGINHHTVIGKDIEEAFPDFSGTGIPERFKEICVTGEPWHSDAIKYDDGTISGTFEVYAFQTLTGCMATRFVDVTERRAMEDALAMTQFTVDNAAIGIFWIRIDGTFLYVNNAAATLFGYTREELQEKHVNDISPDAHIRDGILKKIRTEGTVSFELRGIRRDGSLFPMEITSHFIQFDSQEFEFIFTTDLTLRKEAEEALATMNRELEGLVEKRTHALQKNARELESANIRLTEVDRLKSNLLSTVTHELKTPLTSIIGYTKLTSRDFERDFQPIAQGNVSLARRADRIHSNLTVISDEGTRLLGLIDNFLALSRLKAGASSGTRQPVRVNEAVHRAVALSQSTFAAYPDISLTVKEEPDLPPVNVSPDNLVQVVLNLLDNAAKFSNQGEVTLTTAMTDDRHVQIAIRDMGPGIPETEYKKIFEPFHQICEDEHCTINKPPGTGMGLPICRHIVESFDGSISVESPENGGAIFIVELPPHTDDKTKD